ncbi:matrixin family metalloprotease [Lentilactobacillus otakiensis]|uniref:matrixin family metalloprotease n=1 Tax=Lentilactobacillus otakiensis TaxID=481720 RepID=UPI003D168819
MITIDRFFNKKFIWKAIWVGIGTVLVYLLFMLAGFAIKLSPAVLDQNNTPTEQVDATSTPAYSPKTNFHWPTKTISYYITKQTPAHYRAAWMQAVKAWNAVDVVNLIPATRYNQADVILSVKQSYHEGGGTVENIAGGVVGYTSEAFSHVDGVPLFVDQNKSYLIIDSMKQAHYDSVNEQASVAMHELGHDLGLEHSDSPHSIMQEAAPTYLYSIPEVDAKHLRQLYDGVPK